MKPTAFHHAIVAAALCLCPFVAAPGQAKPASRPPAGGERQATPELPDSTLVKRWAELFGNLMTEFKNDGRDPKGIVRGDFSTREILILTDRESEESWVGIAVSTRTLVSGDLQAIGADLYRAWKTA